jgi:Rho termination factor, N-terminal domain
MTKAELESKPLSDLHALAAEAGVERYRMLSKAELIEQLSGEGASTGSSRSRSQGGSRSSGEQADRPPRRRRRRSGSGSGSGSGERGERERGDRGRERGDRERGEREGKDRERRDRDQGRREPRQERERRPEQEQRQEPTPPPAPEPTPAAAESSGEEPRPRRRRRRRFRRRKDQISIQDLLLPPAAGRQAVLCAETREGCTALLRGVAGDLSAASKGPDPVVLLIDPTPEELAEWKREAPEAELVAAGQARHASDALAQAAARAADGDDVILLVDSLTRLAGAYGDAEAAKEFFDAGRAQGSAGGGSLTVVAALERPASDS